MRLGEVGQKGCKNFAPEGCSKKIHFPGRSAIFPEGCVNQGFLEQPRKSALFPEKGTKFTTGKHEPIFLEEVHFLVWVFPKKCTSSRKMYSKFCFWNSLQANPLYVHCGPLIWSTDSRIYAWPVPITNLNFHSFH